MDQHEAAQAAGRLLEEIPVEKRAALDESDLDTWLALVDEEKGLNDQLRAWIEAHSA